jgi:hypothetical protein
MDEVSQMLQRKEWLNLTQKNVESCALLLVAP